MTDAPTPQAIEAEFDMLMVRAGVPVPAVWRDSVLAAFADFRAQLPLLHGPRDHLAEPSNVFSLVEKAGATKVGR